MTFEGLQEKFKGDSVDMHRKISTFVDGGLSGMPCMCTALTQEQDPPPALAQLKKKCWQPWVFLHWKIQIEKTYSAASVISKILIFQRILKINVLMFLCP